jgi:hypothetical protein
MYLYMFILLIVLIILGAAILIWRHFTMDRLNPYRYELKLKKANLVYGDNFKQIKELVLPARNSAFSRSEPVIWLYRTDTSELYLTANRSYDVRIWLQPETVLNGIHVVLDSTENNSITSNLKSGKLPKQQIQLEGDFSKHFKLYCGENQEVVALQVIAPDIMAYLLDNLLDVDIEIIDNQIALISRSAAKTLEKLKATIEAANHIDRLAKVATKVTSL